MIKKNIHTILILLMLVSCSKKKVIFYEYNGVCITRVDEGNQNYFYYGRFDKGVYPDNYIRSEYSGFNSDMGAYLVFKPNKKVEIIRLAGIFNIDKAPPFLSVIDKENETLKFWKWKDSSDHISSSYDSVIELHSILKLEQKRNKENRSRVKVLYN